MEKEFKREKMSAYATYTNECYEEFIKDEYSEALKGEIRLILNNFIWTHLESTHRLSKETERPTFLDWLLRRKRVIYFKVDIKEMLKNPPKAENYIYIPEVEY